MTSVRLMLMDGVIFGMFGRDITPLIKLKRKDVVHLVIASIALEELSLAHILNAEGEKLQAVLEMNPCMSEILEVNRSVQITLRSVINKQMLLQFKLEDILAFSRGEEVPEECEEECGEE